MSETSSQNQTDTSRRVTIEFTQEELAAVQFELKLEPTYPHGTEWHRKLRLMSAQVKLRTAS